MEGLKNETLRIVGVLSQCLIIFVLMIFVWKYFCPKDLTEQRVQCTSNKVYNIHLKKKIYSFCAIIVGTFNAKQVSLSECQWSTMKVIFLSSLDQLWSKLCSERFNCLLAHSSVTGPVLDTNLDKLLGKQWKNAGVSIDLVLIVHRKFIHYHHHYNHHHHDHRDRQPHDHHHHPACLRQVMKTANSNFYFDITCPLPLFPNGQECSFFLQQENEFFFTKNVEMWILKQLFLLPLVLVTSQTILFVIKLCV